jgi:hypothetical protein
MSIVTVSDANSALLFQGSTKDVVGYLESNPSMESRWVYIESTKDILTESEYLDLSDGPEKCSNHPSEILHWDGQGLVCHSCMEGFPPENPNREEDRWT